MKRPVSKFCQVAKSLVRANAGIKPVQVPAHILARIVCARRCPKAVGTCSEYAWACQPPSMSPPSKCILGLSFHVVSESPGRACDFSDQFIPTAMASCGCFAVHPQQVGFRRASPDAPGYSNSSKVRFAVEACRWMSAEALLPSTLCLLVQGCALTAGEWLG